MRYQTIVIDPPWPYEEGFATQSRGRTWMGPITHDKRLPYAALSLFDIAKIPIRELADSDCRLFLWTTNRYLPHAIPLAEWWGFEYRQVLVWHKRDGNMGGSIAPNSAEFVIVATKGSPARITKMPSSVIVTSAPKRHSTKPECFLDYIEQVSPGPYVELFARRHRLGWDVWGDQSANTAELAVSAT